MGPIQTLPELFSWLRRRWPQIAILTFCGALLGIAAALNTPRIYSAIAVVQVINPVIPEDGTGTGAATPTRRVQMIEQQLMSREVLLALGDRHGLFLDPPMSAADRLGLLRRSIRIEAVAAAQQGFTRDGSLSAILITTSLGDRHATAAVSNELAQAIVQQSATTRQERAQQAVRFFQQEEARLEASIAALDDEMAAYQARNEALMPGALTLRRDEMRRLEESRLQIERDIVQLQAELAALDARSARAVTQRRMDELNAEIGRRTQEADLVALRIDDLNRVLQRVPEVERELAAMDRRMTQLQAQLTSAAERRRDAEVGQRIEVDQQSERFELLETALVPDYPVSRSRRTVATLGVMAGLMAGLVFAYLAEWANPVIRTAAQMERVLNLRPVISIPYDPPPAERRRRMMIWLFGAAILILGAGMVALRFF